MAKITPCLWFDGAAEEAANFYITLLPDSRIDRVVRSPVETPAGPAGMVIVVEFTLAGMAFVGLNGGPQFPFTEAVSFQILTEDQAETDLLSDAIIANGGQQQDCGWVKDRWGLSWQITPRRLIELTYGEDQDAARRAWQAMMTMTRIDISGIESAASGD